MSDSSRKKTKVVAIGDPRRALIKAIAMDIGKDLVAYIEVMYPEAIRVTASTFKLAIRNSIHNDIVGLLDAKLDTDEKILAWLKERGEHRRQWLKMWRNMRTNPRAIITKGG